MENNYQMEVDDLMIGLTKPPTKFGVPFIPFFMSIIFCFFMWMLFQAILGSADIKFIFLCVMIWLFSYTTMLLITSKDRFGLHIYWVNLQYFRPLRTRKKWGNTDAYQA